MRREFTNELGNRITIIVTQTVCDTDLVCTSCRWRAGHAPECERAAELWPTMQLPVGETLVRIEGPSSVSENYLTPMEVAELSAALIIYGETGR